MRTIKKAAAAVLALSLLWGGTSLAAPPGDSSTTDAWAAEETAAAERDAAEKDAVEQEAADGKDTEREAADRADAEKTEALPFAGPVPLEPGPVILQPSQPLYSVNPVKGWGNRTSLPAWHKAHSLTSSIPVSSNIVGPDDKGFIETLKLPKDMTYEPFSRLSPGKKMTDRDRAGILTARKGKITGAALIYQVEMKNTAAESVFGDLFDPKVLPAPAIQKIFFFNAAWVRSEELINDFFLEAAEDMRKEGTPVPYGFASVDFGTQMEQLHRVSESPVVYTFSAEPRFVIDGFVFPLYIRGCLMKHDDAYRFFFLAAPDSERPVFDDAAWKLVQLSW